MTSKLTSVIKVRNSLHARGPDGWLDLDEAAIYLGFVRRSVRNLVYRRQLLPDGRASGPLFRRSTLDAFLESRAAKS